FAAQVAKTPDATAAIYEQHSLSYRALDARANQLAHHLRAQGVGPEVVVGLCLERSLEMLVALLGILKAGGAYLPLDPDYPRARPRLSPGAAPLPARGCARPAARPPPPPAPAAARDQRPHHLPRCRGAAHRHAPPLPPAQPAAPAHPRLCHLHIRINRHAKGR